MTSWLLEKLIIMPREVCTCVMCTAIHVVHRRTAAEARSVTDDCSKLPKRIGNSIGSVFDTIYIDCALILCVGTGQHWYQVNSPIMNKPALYASAHNLEVRDTQNIVDEFAEELGKMSGRCIDIGTGPGNVLVESVLPKLDPKSTMVCSDISEDMLNFAKTKYGGNDRLSFVKLDITARDLPKDFVGQFDHMTSIYCLHWCNDVRQAFRNMFTLLRPGGTVLLNFLSSSPLYDSWSDLAAMPRYEPFMKDKNTFTTIFHHDKRPTETLKKMIRDAGFNIGHLSARQETHIYNDQDTVSDLLVSVNPFIDRMPADLRKEYKEDLVKTFLNQDTVFQKYNTKNECSILYCHSVYVVYLKKPASG